MKKFTMLLGIIFAAFALYGQSGQMSPGEIEKLQAERDAIKVEAVQPSMDRAPAGHHIMQPGYVQPVFRGDAPGYAWNVWEGGSGIPEGPVHINLADGSLLSIQEVSSDVVWMSAGEMAEETWYTASFDPNNSGLYTVDPASGDYAFVGQIGHSITGLAYDPVSGVMYASAFASPNSILYTVDLETGAGSLVGTIAEGIIISIAGDADGNIYGTMLQDNSLYTIDPATGAGTLVGPLGVDINYAQDIAYDRDNDVLYGALYTTQGGLYEIDTGTGQATLINQFVAEVAGFGIPYTLADDDAPAAVADFTVTAGEEGALEAMLSWVNPDETVDGSTLAQLDHVIIERGGEVIETIDDPEIGGAETYLDEDITEAGIYIYRVYGVNEAGEGIKTTVSLYVGEDVPAAPSNVELVAEGNFGHVSWEAPTEGLNGGYLSGENITYTLVRMPGAEVVAEEIEETEFLDTTVPGIGNYYYMVTAGNNIGDGGFAVSNVALLGAEGILFYETFDYETGDIPPGYIVQGLGQDNWYVHNSNTAGGQAPQMRLSWSPSFDGLSRLVTPAINVEGYNELRLKLKQYLNNWAVAETTLSIQVSFDGGETWENLWFELVEGDIAAHEAELFFVVPEDATEAHIGFEFKGDSFDINNWDIDDIILEPVVEDDLVGVSVRGNTTPSATFETIYTVRVQNAGTNAQSDYAVKLMKEGDVELSSVEGTPIEFGETIEFELPWTPEADDVGPTFIYGYVDFAGDEMPGNNRTPNLNVVVMPEDILVVTIGDGASLQYLPYNFLWDYSLSQTLYYPEEIGMGGGVITGMQYYNSFNEGLMEKEIMIWLGETQADDLSGGWVDPATLQLVFDGKLDFPAGENDIFIHFDDIYVYGGGNLVVYSYKMDDDWSGGKNFFNTEDPGSNRSRRAQRDGTPYNPAEPDQDGSLENYFPNVSMFFSTAGLGALEGTVTENGDPIEGVKVSLLGTNSKATTDADGFYEFPYLLPDTYDLEFYKFGYEVLIVEDVVVEEEETTIQDALMVALETFAVSGTVTGNDGPVVADAMVTLQGYDHYSTTTGADGDFAFEQVYIGTYVLSVAAEGYDHYLDEELAVDEDLELDITLIETIVPPFGLAIDTYEQDEGNALFSWNEAELLMLYQHDGEIPESPNAFYQTDDYVYGTIFDLSDYPDAQVNHIDFHHLQWGIPIDDYDFMVHIVDWANFEIIESVGPLTTQVNDDWEEEVMLGMINVAGYEQVGVLIQPQGFFPDDAYPCITTDATGPNGLSLQAPLNDLSDYTINGPTVGDFFINLWISTAHGGKEIVKAEGLMSDNVAEVMTRRGPAVPVAETGLTQYYENLAAADKAFLGFNVFLDEDQVAEEIEETEYLFIGLEEGDYTAGVQSVYTTGTSDILTIDFNIMYGVPVTINVTTNSGDSPEGAHVTLTNQDIAFFTFTEVAGEDGIIHFESVRKGTYTLHILLENFHHYIVEDIDIQEEFSYDAELVEIITEPYGLTVETEGLDQGNALFKWNQVLGPALFEDFETGEIPDGWDRIITNTGTGGPVPATWTVNDYVTTDFAPFGTYHAGLWWDFGHQDEWLISPEVYIGSGFELEFWSAVFLGSTNADHYYVKVSTDGGDSWTVLWDASAESGGWNYYASPFVLDLGDYSGQHVHIAFNAVDGPTNDGLWYIWFVDNVAVGPEGKRNTLEISQFDRTSRAVNYTGAVEVPDMIARDGSALTMPVHVVNTGKAFLGFNVFLNDSQVATGVEETEFLFTNLPTGEHTAGVQSVYTSGSSDIVTIDFEIEAPTTFEVTFHVELTKALEFGLLEGFDPDVHHIMITGSLIGWAEPGALMEEQLMEWLTDDPMVYGKTFHLESGTFQYKYFSDLIGDGWDGGEWAGDPNRVIEVDGDMVVEDMFGPDDIQVIETGDALVLLYPNPARNMLFVESSEQITGIRMIDMLGQVVYSTSVHDVRHQINVSGLNAGIYFIQLTTGTGIVTHRVQVSR